jgi:hypothetical protein
VLNDTIYKDNRIPPRGFTNARFAAVQSPPVAHSYADGQHWDSSTYELPAAARFVRVNVYYQSVSKEFMEFLRDENHTNNAGQLMYDAWAAHGRAAPVAMVSDTLSVGVTSVAAGGSPPLVTALGANRPNPMGPSTRIAYSLAAAGQVQLSVYDVRGRLVRSLVGERQEAGSHAVTWDGRNESGESVPSGIYLFEMKAGGWTSVRKAVLMR